MKLTSQKIKLALVLCVTVCVVAGIVCACVLLLLKGKSQQTDEPKTANASAAMTDAAIGDMIQDLNLLDTSFLNPVNWSVNFFNYDKKTKMVTIRGSSASSLDVIPAFLTLSDLNVEETLTVEAGDPLHPNSSLKLSSTGLEVSGTWGVGGTQFNMIIRRDSEGMALVGSANQSAVSVDAFLTAMGESKFLQSGWDAGLSVDAGLDSFSLQQAEIAAFVYSNTTGYTISVSGIPTISGWGSMKLTVLLQRMAGKRSVVTTSAIFPLFSLSALVKQLTGIDMSAIPVIGTLTLKEIGLIISSNEVNSILLPINGTTLAKVESFPKGATVVATFSLISGIPAVPYVIRLYQGKVTFESANEIVSISGGQLLQTLIPDVDPSGIVLPPGIPDIFDITVSGFFYDADMQSITVVMAVTGDVDVIARLVTVSDFTVMINVTMAKPRKIAVSGNANWTIGSSSLSLTVEEATAGNSFVVRASASKLAVGEVLTQFGAAFLPGELETILHGFGLDSFEILNPLIEFSVRSGMNDMQLYLSGMPSIAGWARVTLKSLLVKKGKAKTVMVAGFEFTNMPFAALLHLLTGLDVTGISLLDQAMDIAVIVSPQSLPGVSLEGDLLGELSIRHGVSLLGVFTFPADCAGALPCMLGKTALGSGTDIHLTSTIVSAKQFILTAGLSDETIGGTALEFLLGTMTPTGITASWSNIEPTSPIHGHHFNIQESVALMDAAFGNILQKLNFFDSSYVNPVSWPVNFFNYDSHTKTVTVKGSSPSSVAVIPSLLTLSNVTVDMTLIVESGDPLRTQSSLKLSLTQFEVSGTWSVGGNKFDLTITKDSKGLTLAGSTNQSAISVDAFLSAVGELKFLPDGLDTVLSTNAGLDSFSLRRPQFAAFYSNTTGYAMSLSGIPTISGWGSIKLTVLLQRLSGQRSVVTMSAIFPSFSVSALVKQLTSIDMSAIPVIGTLTLREIGLVISSNEINSFLLPNNNTLLASIEPFQRGATIVVTFSLISGGPARSYAIRLHKGKVMFEPATGLFSTTAGQLLQALFPDVDLSSVVLPPGILDIFAIAFHGFSYDADMKSITVVMGVTGNVDLIPRLLTVADYTVTVDVTVATPRKISVSGDASWIIGSTNFSLAIEEAVDGNSFGVRASAGQLAVGEVLIHFGAAFLPNELETTLRSSGLDRFQILNPVIEISVASGVNDSYFYLSGVPIIAGWADVTLKSILVKKGTAKAVMAAGFEFASTHFASLLHLLTGVDVTGISLLDQAMKLAVVISPQSIPVLPLEGDLLDELSINRGLSIVGAPTFPTNCARDVLCILSKMALGSGTDTRLKSTIVSAEQFVLAVYPADISPVTGGTFSGAALELRLGNKMSIAVTATWSDNEPAMHGLGNQSNSIKEFVAMMNADIGEMLQNLDLFDSSFVNPVNWPVKFFNYEGHTKTVTIRGSSESSLDVIPSFLTLSKVSAEVSLTVESGDPLLPDSSLQLSLTGFEVHGTWAVGSILFDLAVTTDSRGLNLAGSANQSAVAVDAFLSAVGESNFLPDELNAVLSANAGLDSFFLRQTQFAAFYSNTTGYAISLSGIPTISGWGSVKLTVLLQHLAGQGSVVMMTAIFPSFSLSVLVKQLTGIDMSAIPVIGTLTLKEIGLVISSKEVNSILLPSNNTLLANSEPFQKGATVVATFRLISGRPAVSYVIRLHKGKVTFEPATRLFSTTAGQLLQTLFPDVDPSSVMLPPGMPDIFAVTIHGFSYDADMKSITVVMGVTGNVDLIPRLLTVADFTVTVDVTVATPRKTSVSGDASWIIGSTNFSLAIEEVADGNSFGVRASASQLAIGDILTQFGAVFLPGELETILRSSGLDSFEILKPLIKFTVGSGVDDTQLYLSGATTIAGWTGVTLNSVLVKKGTAKAVMAAGFEFASTSFAAMLKLLTGIDVTGISLLDQAMKIAVIVSPQSFHSVSLQGDLLSELSVNQGLSILGKLKFNFSADCTGDLLCTLGKRALGSGVDIRLKSTIVSAKQFVLTAGTMSGAALELWLGNETSIVVTAAWSDNGPAMHVLGNQSKSIKEFVAMMNADIGYMLQNLDLFDSSFVNPVNWPVKFFKYDGHTKKVTLRGSSELSVDVIPSLLTLSEISAKVTLTAESGDPLRPDSSLKLSLTGFEVSGTWVVGNVKFDLTITKDSKGLSLAGSANQTAVSVDAFLSAVGEVKFLPDELNGVLSANAGLDRFSLQRPQFTAFYSNTTGYAISLSGIPTISGWGSIKLTVLLQRLAGQGSVVTMTAIFPSFSLSALVKQLTGIDMSAIPVIGTLTLKEIGLVISSNEMNSILLPSNNTLLAKVEPFQKGATVVATFSLISGGPAISYAIRLHKGKVEFEPASVLLSFNVGDLLQTLIPDFDPTSIVLPPGIPNIFATTLRGFSYDADMKAVTVVMAVAGTVDIIPGVLAVSDFTLTVDVTVTTPRKIAVSGDATWTIGSANFSLVIEKAVDGNSFDVRASASHLAIGEVISQFGAAFLPGELETILRVSGLDSFEILNPVIELSVRSGVNDMQLYLSGAPSIAGWAGVTLNTVLVKKGKARAVMAAGFEFTNTSFAVLLNVLTGLDVTGISLLDQAMKLAVIISPQSIPGVPLEGDLLGELSINRGLSLVGALKFPADCAGDLLCTLGKTALGSGTDIRLKSTIASAKQFILTAGPAGGTLSGAKLELQLGIKTAIGITVAWSLKDPDLHIQGNSIIDSVAMMDAAAGGMLQNLTFFHSSSVNPANWPVNFFNYDGHTKTMTIRGSSASSVDVIPSFLTLSEVSVEVTLTVVSGDPLRSDSLSKLSMTLFEVGGTWAVGGIKFDLTITRDSRGLSLTGSANQTAVSVDALLSAVGESTFLPDGLDAVLSTNAGLDSFSLRQPQFAAFYSNTTGYAVSLSGVPTVSGWGSIKLTVLLQRLAGQGSVVTMTAIFPSFSLSALVKQLTGIDMSAIPVVGTLTLKEIGLVISSNEMNSILLPSNNTLLAKVEPFQKGATVVATFSLISGGPATSYAIRLHKGKVEFEPADVLLSFTVGDLLQTLIPDFDPSSIVLPPGIPSIFATTLRGFSYDAYMKAVTVVMAVAGTVDIIPSVLIVSDFTLTVDVTVTAPRKIAVSGDATWTIGSANFSLVIEKAVDGNSFDVRASASQLAIGEVISQFGAAFLPGELETILHVSGLDSFEILNPVIELVVHSGVNDMQLYLSGAPSIAGWAGVTLNTVLVKKGKARAVMAAGFEFTNTSFAVLLNVLTGLDVTGISLLDQAMKLAVIISPQSIPGVPLEGDLLGELSINRGLSLVGALKFPADCAGDLLCTLGKTALGSGTDIRLKSTIASAKQFILTAVLAGGTLSGAKLELQLGIETAIGITVAWSLKDPDLHIQGNSIIDSVAMMDAATGAMLQNRTFFHSSSVNPANWPVNFFNYDGHTKTMTIRGSSASSVDVIPSFLTLSEVSVEVTLTVVSGDPLRSDSLSKLSMTLFEVGGTWAVGGIKFDLTITKDSRGLSLTGSANQTAVSVDALLSAVGESKFLPDGLDAVLSAKAGLDSFSLRQPQFAAFYSNTTGYAVSLSGAPTVSGWGSIKLTVLLQRLAGQGSVVTMTAIFPSFSLSALVKQLTGIDMSAIPVIGTLTLKEIGLVISSNEMNPILLPSNNTLLAKVEPFQKGATVVATFSLISGGPAISYAIRLHKGKVEFEPASVLLSFTVGDLLQTLIPDFDPSSIVLPPGIPNIFATTLRGFSYDADMKAVTVVMALAGNVDMIPSVLTVSDFTLTVDVTVTTPRKIAVSGHASWTIGSANFSLAIEKAGNGNSFVVRASASQLAIGEFLSQFGAAFLPGELETILHVSGLDSFEILNPVIELSVRSGVNDMQLYLSGAPSIAGWAGVTLNSVLVKKGAAKAVMAAGFELPNTNFAAMLNLLTGIDVTGISLLDQAMKAAVIISPQSIHNVSLQGDLLGELSINKGLSVVSMFKFPADCVGDLLCTLGKTALGSGVSIHLKSTIVSAKQFVLIARLAGGPLSGASLEIQLGNGTSITSAWSHDAPVLPIHRNQSNTVKEIVAMMDAAIGDKLLNLNFLYSSFVNPVNWPVDFFNYDGHSKTLTIRGSSASSVDVIPSFLTLSEVSANVSLTVESGDPIHPDSSLKLSLTRFEVSGTWAVGSNQFDLTVTKDSKGLTLAGSANPSSVSVDTFLASVGELKFLPDGLDAVLSANAGLDSFSVQQTQFAAFYSKTTGYAVSLSGIPTINGWGSVRLTVILQRLTGQRSAVIMTAIFPSFRFSALVKQLIGIDFSAIPVIGGLTLNEIGLVISSDEVNSNLLPNNNALIAKAEPFQKGATVVATFSLISGGQAVPYVIRLHQGNVTFEPATGSFSYSVGQLLQTLIPNVKPSVIVLPPGIPGIFAITVQGFSYDANKKSITVVMTMAGNVNLIPSIVTVSDFTLTIDVTVATPRKITVLGDASWIIGSVKFLLAIEKAVGGNSFVVQASASKLAIGEILTKFGAAFLPRDLETVLRSSGLGSFDILNPAIKLRVSSGVKDMQLHLSGVPSIAGWTAVTLNSVLVKKAASSAVMAAGFEFASTNMAALLRSLTGVDVSKIPLLNREMKSAIIISPLSISGLTLEGDLLSDLSIKRGISLVSKFKFPADCAKDLLCQFVTKALGSGSDTQLTATITSTKQFVLTAGLADISLGTGLTLSPVNFEVQLGVKTSVGLTVTLTLTNPSLQFHGAIRATSHGLEMTMIMQGIWERAFGIKYLAFGNLIISTNIIPGVALTGLQLGGEVRIGDLNSGREVIGKCYVGYDKVFVHNRYYYASISNVSIGSILNAFGISVPLPRVLTESGFPDGLLSSFAYKDMEPVPGVLVPAGFKFNGTMNIIGLKLSALIDLDPPRGLDIAMNMPAIDLSDGLFQFYKSKSDKSHGPFLNASIRTLPPSVAVKASGFARVLGLIEVSAELEITNTEYIMNVSGRLFLFDVALRFSASYGQMPLSFRVYGKLLLGLNTITDAALDYIKKGADFATKAITAVQDTLAQAHVVFDAAVSKFDDAKKVVDAAQTKVDSAVAALNSAQDKVNGLCSIRTCSSVCVGCPGWDSCCAKVWGNCVGCPKWNSCCTRVTDRICVAANAACQILRGAAYLALEVAKKVLHVASTALDAAKLALSAAQAIVDQSRIAVDLAIAALETAKNTFKAGLDAVTSIAQYGLSNLISIRKIEFSASIRVAATGSFSGTVEATLLGFYSKFSFSLNLNDIGQMASSLAEKVFPGILTMRKRRSVAGTPREIQQTRPNHLHGLSWSGNKYTIDGVDRALGLERSRRALEQLKIKREASNLKAAAKRIEYVPQQNVHLNVDDLHLDKLKSSPATREEACLQAESMMSVLETVAGVVHDVCNGWKESWEQLQLEGAKVAAGLATNENDNSEDVAIMVGAVSEWKLESQRFLERRNADALMTLGTALEHEVESLTGMTLKIYLGHAVAALKRPYQMYPQRNRLMRSVIDIINEKAQMANSLFDKTIDEASITVDVLVDALTRIRRATELICK